MEQDMVRLCYIDQLAIITIKTIMNRFIRLSGSPPLGHNYIMVTSKAPNPFEKHGTKTLLISLHNNHNQSN